MKWWDRLIGRRPKERPKEADEAIKEHRTAMDDMARVAGHLNDEIKRRLADGSSDRQH